MYGNAMTPRRVGILGMIFSLGIAVVAGMLIPQSPTAILGALLLVAASIGFAISTTWLYRKSWEKDSWPTLDLSAARYKRRLRRVAIFQGFLTLVLVCGAVWDATQGNFGMLLIPALSIVNVLFLIRRYRIAVSPENTDESEP
ncbi:MAG: hypothetical protein JWM49_1510 [Microbacteriaceae bacterium]|nr:hypothetical protein [Microbacteriaceae bacterium]